MSVSCTLLQEKSGVVFDFVCLPEDWFMPGGAQLPPAAG
jgi:hypothetical protein